MEGLFNINSILLHVLNTAILFTALYFLLYKPVRRFMKAREDKIEAQLQAGREAQEGCDALMQKGRDALAKANEDAARQSSDAAQQAQLRAQAAIEEADAEAKKSLPAPMHRRTIFWNRRAAQWLKRRPGSPLKWRRQF